MLADEVEHGAGIAVRNAGLVLLSSFFRLLFERLGLMTEGTFDSDDLTRPVRALQYLAAGVTDSPEDYLPLNKVLCGLPLSQAVGADWVATAEERALIDGLIKAAIGHWAAIGDTSVDGFRGNWLVRDGLLTETAERWELVVEKRAYDLLIDRSPFAFGLIKFAWMAKPLHVTWRY